MTAICITPGCYVIVKSGYPRCLACCLDLGITPPGVGPPGGVRRSLTPHLRADGRTEYCAVSFHHERCLGCRCSCHERRAAA
jgi:hypothetical protein